MTPSSARSAPADPGPRPSPTTAAPPTPQAAPAAGVSGRGLSYADAGVDLGAKDAFTESLDTLLRRTHGPRVIRNPGGFAGLFRLDYNERLFARNYRQPVLVACADGVGTKLKLAAQLRRYDTIGIDLVAMNVNDLIVQGAEPLFFLDYIAVPKVDRAMLTALVAGMVEGCRRAGCALLGGETAEMPDVYAPGEFDLAGFAVGVMDLDRATTPERVQAGDVVLGLASSGVHSNGYSLVRRIVAEASLDLAGVYQELQAPAPGSGRASRGRRAAEPLTLGQALLTPTRIYAGPIVQLLRSYRVKKVITGMAHITGSGMAGNLCRALHGRVDAVVDCASWPVPAIFGFLQKAGRVGEEEMRRVFNMGIGFCLIVRPAFADSVLAQLRKLGERVYAIGRIERGTGQVRQINLGVAWSPSSRTAGPRRRTADRARRAT
jgi:phosphoribosylformylglycinamidine cyclo-ligase